MDLKFLRILFVLCLVGGLNSASVEVPCSFSLMSRGYTCRLPDVNLANQDVVISGGNHLLGFNDESVVNFVSINNNFRHFPNLGRFPNLRHVQVSGGLIQTILQSDLVNHTALETINLSNNQIDRLDQRPFANNPNLQELHLRFNRVRNLAPEVFVDTPNLLILDLSYNSVERLSSGNLFATNQRMTHLQLSGNRIDFINRTIFDNLGGLLLFDFTSNFCYSELFFGINVPSARNQMLQRLAPCFSDAPVNIRCDFDFLNMNDDYRYGCLLTDVELYDESSQVAIGGFHIFPNTNNEVIFLRIQLSHTPFIIRELFTTFPNLEGLEVIFSSLQRINSDSFAYAGNLRYINIRNNPIRRLEANVFQNATNLEQLFLWWNTELDFLSEYAFSGLEKLNELHLVSSSIPYIQPQTFRPLVSLRFLELGQNRLDLIDSRWFSTNRQLGQLMMNSNDVSAIHPSLLDLPELSALFLEGNICVSDVFFINDIASREMARSALRPCFDNYPNRKRRFFMTVEGEVTISKENGTEIITF